jgi:hypothetical protein
MAGQKENSCERRDKLLRAIQISFQLGNSLKEFAVALPARQLAEKERRDKLLRAIQISFQLGNSLKEFAVTLPARQLAGRVFDPINNTASLGVSFVRQFSNISLLCHIFSSVYDRHKFWNQS